MILDAMVNEEHLKKLHPGFGPALEFLRRPKLDELAEGRHEIDGARLYAMVVRGPGKGQKGTKLEAHRRYIDIQYSLHGFDIIGWKQASTCHNPLQPYDPQRDIQYFSDASDTWVTVPEGCFGIFYPQDAHAPNGNDGPLHKIIVKIAVDWP